MGTNTDPYQRCEGKYHLTQGIIEVLSAARNPFSILTKSTLILRDLELLREASTRTDVGVNLSIATLDEEVWKTTEPGTPHPRRRVEAVAKLNEAGIRCGVLVAPILPGLSDHPDQVEEVVKACAEAGATSISGLALHLRPGVREQFMPWLEEAHPELVEEYTRLYPRSYASKAERERVSGMIRDAADRHGGRRVSPVTARRVQPVEPEPAPEPAPTQLGLGL
jgi:DNA repair photolyase